MQVGKRNLTVEGHLKPGDGGGGWRKEWRIKKRIEEWMEGKNGVYDGGEDGGE